MGKVIHRMRYWVEDMGEDNYLDGIQAQYKIYRDRESIGGGFHWPVAYVFHREDVEMIIAALNAEETT